MKEMYVKPMVEMLVFDHNSDIITASSIAPNTANESTAICSISNDGRGFLKDDGCKKDKARQKNSNCY